MPHEGPDDSTHPAPPAPRDGHPAAADDAPTPGAWSDAELLAELRVGREAAFAEFFVRLAPLLRDHLRPHQVDPAEQEAFVSDLLADVALEFTDGRRTPPRSLKAMMLTILRRRVIDRHRRAASREMVVVTADDATLRDAAAAAATRLAALGPDVASSAPEADERGVLVRLAAHLDQHVDEADRQVLVALGERVPQRVIAAWQGVSAGAMRMRITRLRERLRTVARTFVGALDAPARDELARFFRRADAARPASPPTPSTHNPRGRRHGAPS